MPDSREADGLLQGRIFDIQPFSIHDGPGIRTTLFLKGCPLHCLWCHNPESWRSESDIFFRPDGCVDCRACVGVCTVGDPREILAGPTPDACRLCLRCAEACPHGALEQSGASRSVDSLLAEVEKDRVFFEESGGGMTLSGGEPMAQFPFSLALAREARRRGISVCVETSGVGENADYAALVPFVDLFLWDIKHTDADTLHRLTGARWDAVLQNLRSVDDAGGKTVLRCIITRQWHDQDAHWRQVAETAKSLRHFQEIQLLPCHELGDAKWQKLRRSSPAMENLAPDEEAVNRAAHFLRGEHFPVTVM